MNILNESVLRDMMLQIVKETRPSLEEDVNANVDESGQGDRLMQTEFLTATAAAEYLGVSRSTFWRLRRDYPIRAYFFEVSYPRFKRSDLDEWAEQFKE